HTAVDTLFEHIHRTLPPAVLRELAPNARHRHRIRLGAGLQMAILAGEIVTGKTFRRVRNPGPDLVWRIARNRVPVSDKSPKRILTNLADIGGCPLCQIIRDRLCGRHMIASYPYTGTQNSNYEPNTLHRAGSPRCRSASSSSYHQSRSCGARSSRRNAAARCGAFNDALSYGVKDRRLSPSRSAPEAYRASGVDAGPTRRSGGVGGPLSAT